MRMQLRAFVIHLLARGAATIQSLWTRDEFNGLLAAANGGRIIVKYFTRDCPPCKLISPAFESIAQTYGGDVHFAEVDVVANRDTAVAMGIKQIPTFQFFFEGRLALWHLGAEEQQLRSAIASFMGLQSDVAAHASVEALAPSQGQLHAQPGEIPMSCLHSCATPVPCHEEQAALPAAPVPCQQEQANLLTLGHAPCSRARLGRATGHHVEELVILGAGPAGTSAALQAGRKGLCPLVVAPVAGGALAEKGVDLDNYAGLPGGSGPSMVEWTRRQALGVDAEFLEDSAVSVDASACTFTIRTASGRTLYAKALIVATGATSRWLGVEGEKALKGRGVSGCAVCDGFRYRGGKCAVIGGGDTAAEEALLLARHCSQVIMVHRRETLRAQKALQQRLLAEPKISVIYSAEVVSFKAGATDGQLQSIELRSTAQPQRPAQFLQVNAAFVAIGRIPNIAFLKGGVQANDQGYLHVVPGSTYTSLAGLFAAGDVSDHIYRQAITSVGSGTRAVDDAQRYLSGGAPPSTYGSEGTVLDSVWKCVRCACACVVIHKCCSTY